MATHFVHEVLWDKGFRINTLANVYQPQQLEIQFY
jgi:hypothetical protein